MSEELVALLRSSADHYISGNELSRQLQISRTAVWKQIQRMKEKGYVVEAYPRQGYKLISAPDFLEPSRFDPYLRTKQLGRRIHWYEQVDSTQNLARKLAEQGAPSGTLVLAEQQTLGRGRQGRHWHSPQGKGVYMSLVIKPEMPVHMTPHLTLLTAVALCRAIRTTLPGIDPGIKWPNDLLVNGKKASGILMESISENETLQYIITGVGINCNLQSDDYPDELRSKATSLSIEAGQKVDRVKLIADFLLQLEELYLLYATEGFEPIRSLWEASSHTLGQSIIASTAAGTYRGTATGLDQWGGLILESADGTSHTVYSADYVMAGQ